MIHNNISSTGPNRTDNILIPGCLIFLLVSVAEHTALSLTLSETPKTGFLVTRTIYKYNDMYLP